jgi:hypothetical protein
MNNKIEQLVGKAGGYISHSYEHDGCLTLSGDAVIERFAASIIKECTSVLEDEIEHEQELINESTELVDIRLHEGKLLHFRSLLEQTIKHFQNSPYEK